VLGGRRRDQKCTITMSDAQPLPDGSPSRRAPLGRAGLFFFVKRILSIAFRTLKHPTTLRALREGAVAALLKTARKYLPREKANVDQRYSIVAQILGNVKKC
jgi:hypothetical protein